MGLFSFVGDIIGDITGTNKQAKAAGKAADLQAAAAQAGIDETKRQFDVTQDNFAPYLGAGEGALGELMALLGLPTAQNGYTTAPFDPTSDSPRNGGIGGTLGAIEALKDSPLFQSLYRTGEEAILQNAAATGGLRGGNTQRSLADFGADTLAKVIQDRIANLSGIVNLGQNSAAGVGTLGAQKSASIADLLGQQGAAQAGGVIAQGNKQANAINSGLKLASSIAGFF